MARYYKVPNQKLHTSEYSPTPVPWAPVFIVGSEFDFRSNPDFVRTGAEFDYSIYGKVPAKQFSALLLKYSGYYRIFVVNHEHMENTIGSFQLRIDTNEISNSGWTKAVDNDGYLHDLADDVSIPEWQVLSDTMTHAHYVRIYEIGSGVQNLE